MPFESDARAELGAHFGIRGIPSVVVLSAADGHVIKRDARSIIGNAASLEGLFSTTQVDETTGEEGSCSVS